MITPFKKPPGGELLNWQKEFNTQVNKIRWVIEQVISHFKNWRIMHTERLIQWYGTFRKIYLSGGALARKMARFPKGLGYQTQSGRNEPSACIIPRDSAATR
jgi:hypothetical protein